MLEDLCTYISQWRDLGDYIVLIVDLNEMITADTVTEIFANVGRAEAIFRRHCDTGLLPTYQRGSHPIDGIYTSINFQISSVVYLSFLIIPSYHCLLWLKSEFDSAFGAKMDTLVPHPACRLNCQKIDTVKCFIELYKNFIRFFLTFRAIIHTGKAGP